MDKYLESLVQKSDINFVQIYFGNSETSNIFELADILKTSVLEKFKTYRVKQVKNKIYQAGNKFKNGDEYYKLVQVEDSELVKNNIFKLSENEAIVLLYKKTELKGHDFPCKMEYTNEKTYSILEISYTETIKIKIIDEKRLIVEVLKDAYIDNTIRELTTLINELDSVITDSNDN